MTWTLAPVAAREPGVAAARRHRPVVARARTSAAALLMILVLLATAARAQADAPAAPDGWIPFEANWSAAGRERILAMGDRTAATFDLAGPFVVTRGDGLSRGFFAQAIGFIERGSLGIGRLVLQDDHD